MPRVVDQDTGIEFLLFNSEELKRDLSEHFKETCAHVRRQVGRVKYKNSSVHVRECCLDCGEFTGPTLPKSEGRSSLELIEHEVIRVQYNNLKNEKHNSILQKHVSIQKKKEAGFQKEYIKYLSSEKWRKKRALVLKRANFICEGCLENEATVVHHRNYKSIYSEMLFDLAAICRVCHAECHPDKLEITDEEFIADDLPCYGCRYHGQNDEGSWCDKFDVHTVIALTDRSFCGPKAAALEPLK